MFSSYSLPAVAGRESEDALAVGDGIAVVVDGAGLPTSMRSGCRHAVAWYARCLAEAFREGLENRAVAMPAALAAAIERVRASHAHTCDLGAGSPSATVAAWRIDDEEVEHLVLCDASIVLVGRDGAVREVTDDRIDAAVERRASELLREGAAGGEPAEEEVAAARLAALDETRNRDGGFWCCHTDPRAAGHALTGRSRVDELAAIVAASDGGTRGFQLLDAHPIERFGALAVAGRLADIAAEIRAAEDTASLRFAKTHDDILLAVETF
ncbi:MULTISPECIES: protein phosphatase 2C domain-containing protein [Microbacterium]|uniref:protein phosphatase 2C domain-containing protein n=1 Tax=Microbacterium TaxID=33882 RepID=UPI00217EAAA0|nr:MULTISPECIES: protein phosphatase 2C domain-containing protein [Microbacterium]UWF77225.1 protein phosphatase 2C domain-containing protein [Microbacterium neungamense]WCM55381.1 protein phosphatase 2C domain-containing protein [Microbacterium sp. EF45047]